ncbi:MAG: EF-Tu/IF-2/RF-3 family GTPase [Candidatus Poseidonia sp.]|jgi:selenocysteine-specific translation elongation factor|nr:EF-Tu/IF-2/RF-3 family GTPase [Poseidonia sp.]
MVVLNIAVIASDELARSIAKAADQRDVHTYVHKENGPDGARILSLIRPAKFPERLPPFLNALSTSQAGIIEITAVDATLGEALVAFASAGIQRGLAVINPGEGGWVDEDQVKMLFKQAGLGSWTFEANDGVHLRERMYALMDEIQSVLEANANAPLVLPVDQYFNVKGIGLVAIGYVQSGRVNVHDEVMLLPANGTGSAKSLQVMDDDVEVATAGDRVGLALRNAKEEHLTGNTIIVHPPVDDKRANISTPLALDEHNRSTVQLTTSPFQKRVLTAGDVIHASVDLQFVVGRIQSVDGSEMTVEWEHPLFIRKDNPPAVLIAQLDSKPRIMGSAVVTPINA